MGENTADAMEEALRHELKVNQLYLAIIARYREQIEEQEHISLVELQTLVTPRSELVIKKASEIKNSFGMYNYNSHFYEASIDVFYFVRNGIEDITMPIEFWLTPEDTLSFGIADLLDRNILLCSLLIALGNPSAKVLVYIRDNEKKMVTYYELGEKIYLLDFINGFKKFGSKAELLKHIGVGMESTCYEFNDNMYQNIG